MTSTVQARVGALELARGARLFVLDIDGVLVDPRPSFYAAARETASWAAERALGRPVGPPVTDEEIQAFKAVGGWNDDFDLACACTWGLIVRARATPALPIATFAQHVPGGLVPLAAFVSQTLPNDVWARVTSLCDPDTIRSRAAVRYSGRARSQEIYGIAPERFPDAPVEGLWAVEPILCERASLELLGGPFGVFTGRNRAEAAMALDRLGLVIAPELLAVDDGATPRKPSPDALVRLAGLTRGPIVFIGDSVDDERAALACCALGELRSLPALVFVRIIHPDEPGHAASEAPIVAPSLDAFARALRSDGPSQVADRGS